MAASSTETKKMQKQMKADMETVKSNIKNGRDLDKAENLVRKYLADSLHREDISLHLMLADVVKKAYEMDNEKMYLKNNVDTASLIRRNRRLFLAYESLDSIDARPNGKGIVSPVYRRRHADYLAPFRKNLFKGALYFYAHRKWDDAWGSIDTYLDCRHQPLFSATPLDSLTESYASYVAVIVAYNQGNMANALKYAEKALTYKQAREVTLMTLANLSDVNRDSIHYVDFLRRGFQHNPRSEYFFPRLVDFYSDRARYAEALQITDQALSTDSLNQMFLLAKHGVLMNKADYDEALRYGLTLLNDNDSLAVPNYNVGYIYWQKAQNAMNRKGIAYRQRMKDAQKWYRCCMGYMERYRKLNPNDKQHWRPILYDIYLNLNMGKEFAEIEQIKD